MSDNPNPGDGESGKNADAKASVDAKGGTISGKVTAKAAVAVAQAEAVRRVNQSFYDALEANDFDAMSAVWHHGSTATCVHPGSTVLRGWPKIEASWRGILTSPSSITVIVTEIAISVVGRTAWVTCDENIVGSAGTSTATTVNIFLADAKGAWRMVAHHGSPVLRVPS